MVKIVDAGAVISDDAMRFLENLIRTRLPKDYYHFLSKNGGGYPEPDCFCFLGEEDGSSVQRFYGINREDSYDFLSTYNTYNKRIPDTFIPIACDPGGNQICLGLKGVYRDKIYFWDHELEQEDDREPDQSNMKIIANSFSQFLDSLYEIEL